MMKQLFNRRAMMAAAACALATSLSATTVQAQSDNWPSRNVTMIVPFPAGGNSDTMARVLAQKLTEKFGQTFVVENRVGASGSIGTTAAARAPADGYTLLFAAFQQISVLPVTEKVNYDPKKDITYISIFGEGPFTLGMSTTKTTAKDFKEFLALAKAKPGSMSYASGGVSSGSHLIAALTFAKAGVNITHVPYRGGSPAVADLLGGHVESYFGNASELIPVMSDPRVKIIVASSAKRLPQLPDVPTVSEFFPGVVMTTWNGLMGPANLPADITDKLAKAVQDAARDPAVIKTLGDLGITTVVNTPAEFKARIASEQGLFEEAIRAAKLPTNQ